MELVTLTKDQLNELVKTATLNATSTLLEHFQTVLMHKEESISVTKAYRYKETAKHLLMSESTVRRNYEGDKKCLLKKNKKGFFLGASVQAEYDRLYGK